MRDPEPGEVELSDAAIRCVNEALHESQVSGFRLCADGLAVELLVLVDTLPEVGPMSRARRRVVMHLPSRVRVLLRRDIVGATDRDPPLALTDFAALERFFAQHITWAHEMYSCEFLDGDRSVGDGWPEPVSLEQSFESGRSDHHLYWWVECGRNTGDDVRAYWLQGLVEFGSLEVLDDADRSVGLEEFGADARRWWDAFFARDDRVGLDAQRAAHQSPGWRWWQDGEGTITVPASAWPEQPID